MDVEVNGDSPRVMSPAEVLDTLGLTEDSSISSSETKLEEHMEDQRDNVEVSQAQAEGGEHPSTDDIKQCLNDTSNGHGDEHSMIDEYHDEDKDGMTDDLSVLSLHVAQSDLDIFNDGENVDCELDGDKSETPANYVSAEQENMFEGEDNEELDSVTTEESEDCKRNTKEVIIPPKSKLHCALCGGLCSDPRMLNCLHSFCLECLQKRTEEKHKLIFCPICLSRMVIPKGGLDDITKNELIANLISFHDGVSKDVNCVICLLHDEVKEGNGCCIDCGDVLCSECCEKHTFSRQTANHSVVTLKDYKDNMLLERRSRVTVMCDKHRDEEVKFFCEKCSITACRDCIMLDHASHPCVTSNEVYEAKRGNIEKGLNTLKELQLEYENDDNEDSFELLKVEGEKLAEKLKETAALAKMAIDEKLEKSLQALQQEMDIKHKQCCNRQVFIKRTMERCQGVIENVDFFLKEGKLSEIVAVDEQIRSKVDQQQQDFRAIHRKLSARSLPYIQVHERNMDTLQGLTLFTVESRDSKKSHSDKPTAKTAIFKTEPTNALKKVQQKKTQGPLSQFMKQPAGVQTQSMGRGRYLRDTPSLLGDGNLYTSSSVGRGTFQFMDAQSNSDSHVLGSMQPSANVNNSCLVFGQSNTLYQGGYSTRSNFGAAASERVGQKSAAKEGTALNDHGQKHRGVQQNKTKGDSLHNDTEHGKQKRGKHNVPRLPKLTHSSELQLKCVVNTKTMTDHVEPDIVGMTFTNPQNFVVMDSRNMKVKLFAMDGKFLDMHSDQSPMSVVSCRDSIVWVSRKSNLKVQYFDGPKHIITLPCKLDNRMDHPLTSFNNEKLILGNHGKPTIKAFVVEGNNLRKVHGFNPHDSDGNVIDHVNELATYKSNVLAMVVNNKVIINDFDGQFISEYSERDWHPGSMCMDERNNLFVVDLAGGRLVLLSDKGQFRHHWTNLTEHMAYITCNQRGTILIGGQNRNVCVYQYG